MSWTIPGTVLTASRAEADHIEEQFHAMFLPGGMVLSQVSGITGLESYIIQNWVKRGFLSPPVGKKYNMEQVCRILNINILKGAMALEQIIKLMAYLNGDLTDEKDDLVDDTLLFFLFVKLAARARYIGGTKNWDEALLEVTEEYQEPVPGAREKLIKVLKIMLTIWCANQLKLQADRMVAQL